MVSPPLIIFDFYVKTFCQTNIHQRKSNAIGQSIVSRSQSRYREFDHISGYPLQLAQRIQFNMFIRPIEGVVSMENVSKALLPIIWVEELSLHQSGDTL
ncbi:hypothetical protein NQ317_010226 [Molorchus minor]|uniref:Uncharacterized protein n=1 Tax=Molorchus minor TaxID=1323400 RepID=A0ABQ9J460_9CUCU|nr:hypothetical protein NQ317_010226 [Molorchus minor]